MKRCTKCVLPENCPKIAFDENGVCNVCKDFDERWGRFKQEKALKKKELDGIFSFYRSKGPKYDCLVPISGGLDSTYALYVCKAVYGLKTLAFNFNNGFQTPTAKQNIENATEIMEVDLVTSSPSWEIAKKLYALFFRKTGEFCTPCNLGIWSMSFKVARDFSIPLIVSGSSDRISERLPKNGRIYSWSTSYFREVIRGEISTKNVGEYLYLPKNFHNSLLRKMSQRILLSKNVSVLPLPDYLDWDINNILHTLKNELNWKQKAEKFHHVDCMMEAVSDHFKQKKWGFSVAPWYSMLVRDGQMTREEALEKTVMEEKRNSQEPPELELWLELLDLSREDVNGFEKRSQVSYIPLQERLRNVSNHTLTKILTHFGVLKYV
jgi:N-acetyl sugar amidotransferase